MSDLSAGDFAPFFEAVHGYSPFPWQSRLAERVVNGEDWPRTLGLPTASGKTACIDIAVFALACQAELPLAQRKAPRRVFFVVDRRVVVDEAYARALKLAVALKESTSPAVRPVANALRQLAGDDDPLAVFALRGGMYLDDSWARSPAQPTVIASTVDQIGSRLLFRSYGSRSGGSWPIHAGLAANDSLILLDEAHCSVPFGQTVSAVDREMSSSGGDLATPFVFVEMTATPRQSVRGESASTFALDDRDREHSILRRRLHAPKPTRLVLAKSAKGAHALARLAEELAKEARALQTPERPLVAVVVNRVATARAVHTLLGREGTETILLTGRMRPFDRDDVLAGFRERVLAAPGRRKKARETAQAHRPLFVVATQCIEVGADFDFDALVTECASLDALRQRFGRLDRLGELAELGVGARGTVVMPASAVSPKDDDMIYGAALRETWAWLQETASDGEIDFGLGAMEAMPGRDRLELRAPSVSAPMLLPAHVAALAQTSPSPAAEPDLSLFLHGIEERRAEIQLVWRADLEPASEEKWLRDWGVTLTLSPPGAAEALPVPLAVFRRWWIGRDEDPGESITDVIGGRDSGESSPPAPAVKGAHGLIWRGPDQSEPLGDGRRLRPGDTVVLPITEERVWRLFGHIPNDEPSPLDPAAPNAPRLPRIDLAERVQWSLRARPTLRLDKRLASYFPAAWPEAESETLGRALHRLLGEIDDLSRSEVREELRRIATAEASSEDAAATEWIQRSAALLADGLPFEIQSLPSGAKVLRSKKRIGKSATSTLGDDGDRASAGEPVELWAHCLRVGERARDFAKRCGLATAFHGDFYLAGLLHDLGKADPRFQTLLHGGDPWAARAARTLLAKSERMPETREALRVARKRSGYPRDSRHEALSVRLAEAEGVLLSNAADRDLVLHLVASHHGYARPFAPAVLDPAPIDVRLDIYGGTFVASTETGLARTDSEAADRFWRLVRRLGPWRLAWFEAIFRLADHRVSEEEGDGEVEAPKAFEARVQGGGAAPAVPPDGVLRPIVFAGLEGSNPLAVLAALGAFMVAVEEGVDVRLGWERVGPWRPVLHAPAGFGPTELLDLLERSLPQRSITVFEEAADLSRVSRDDFRLEAERALAQRATRDLGYLAAFATDATLEDQILDTAFRTMSGAGHQHFLTFMRTLVAETSRDHLEEALFGPWRYEDPPPSMRWDPDDDRRYALRFRDPSKDQIRTVRGANRLAVEALPLLPVMPRWPRPVTTGFRGRGSRDTFWTWPIWEHPTSLDVVRSVLASRSVQELAREMARDDGSARRIEFLRLDLQKRGVVEVYQSQRITVGKYRNFSPGTSV